MATDMYMVKVPVQIEVTKLITGFNFIHIYEYIDLYREGESEKEREREKPARLQLKSKFAVIVTTQDVSQLAKVAMLPARPLIFTGSI